MNLQYYIPNTFKHYLYEVPGAYRKFVYTQYSLVTRTDNYDEGYDDITSIIPILSLNDTAKLRLLPFYSSFSEEIFIEKLNDINYQDCFLTQSWGKDPSKRIQLLQYLNDKRDFQKFSEKQFKDNFIACFYSPIKKDLGVDDLESFDMKVIYNHSRYDNDIELLISNIVFKDDLKVEKIPYDGADYQFVSIKEFAEYYFAAPNADTQYFLDMEILLSPAMIFEYQLLEKLMDKITSLEYDVIGDKWL